MGFDLGAGLGALGAFAEGYQKGKDREEQRAMERQRFEMEKSRLQMELDRANDEKSMREEMKKVNERPKASKVITVKTDEGATVYADEKLATEHVQAAIAAGGKAEAQEAYSVNGKQYESEDEANDVIESMHTPAAMSRRKAEIAEKYFRPDVAAQYQKNYQTELENSRKEIQNTFMDAYRRNDVEGAVATFSDRLANGVKAQVVHGEDGSFSIVKTKNGKPLGEPQTFKTADEFWNGTKDQPGLLQNISITPDNALEMWKAQQGLKLQSREVESRAKLTDANVRKVDQEIALAPQEMALKSRQVGAQETSAAASATSASASVMNAQTGQQALTMPKVFNGVNTDDDIVLSSQQPVYDQQSKQWGLKVTPPVTMKGMQPTGMARPPKDAKGSDLDALLGGGPRQKTLEEILADPNTAKLFPSKTPAAMPPRK